MNTIDNNLCEISHTFTYDYWIPTTPGKEFFRKKSIEKILNLNDKEGTKIIIL